MGDDMPDCDSLRSRVVRPKELAQTQQRSDGHDDRPVEYVVLTFPDGYMSEEVGDELLFLSLMHVIRLLDFVLLTKDDAGMVSVVELNELSQMGGFSDIDGPIGGLIAQQDIELVSAGLDAGSAAAVMLFEDLWATSLSDALNQSGALFLERARVPLPKASWTFVER
jgi:hypothetical protein